MARKLQLHSSAELEERLVRWLMLGAVIFFLFAATVLPLPEEDKREAEKTNASLHLKVRSQHEQTRESLFNEIYRRTFVRLKDEKQRFISAEEAKLMLPGNPESRRKVHCGGWVSDIPSIVLRFMGRRCPPLDLI